MFKQKISPFIALFLQIIRPTVNNIIVPVFYLHKAIKYAFNIFAFYYFANINLINVPLLNAAIYYSAHINTSDTFLLNATTYYLAYMVY